MKSLENSENVISAWDGEKLIGLGNAISDKFLVVFYSHLLVLPEYQNKGIGAEIMRRFGEIYRDFHQQILVSVKDAIPFYEKCGFKIGEGTQTMWVYHGDDIELAEFIFFVSRLVLVGLVWDSYY